LLVDFLEMCKELLRAFFHSVMDLRYNNKYTDRYLQGGLPEGDLQKVRGRGGGPGAAHPSGLVLRGAAKED
jgi:hypothetical protein